MHDSTLRKIVDAMPNEAKSKYKMTQEIAGNDTFWRKVAALVELSSPIVNVLRLCDSDIPATGKVYNEMFVLGELLKRELSKESLDVPVTTMRSVSNAFNKRWKDLHNPLHGAGYLLDPEFHGKISEHVPPECLNDLITMAERVFVNDSDAAAKAVRDWQVAYKEKQGIFAKDLIWRNAHVMPPESWYDQYVKPFFPELGRLGMRVLSQVIAASSCERNWSDHGHIHTDLRNRLAPERIEKAVYVYSNSKVLRKGQAVDLKLKMFKWDEDDSDE